MFYPVNLFALSALIYIVIKIIQNFTEKRLNNG